MLLQQKQQLNEENLQKQLLVQQQIIREESFQRALHEQQQQQQQQQEQQNQLTWQCAQMHFKTLAPFQDQYTRIIYTILMPVVCVLGSIGAVICILIFTRRQMRSSLSIYLAGLSAFDLLLLLMSLLIYPSMNLCMQEGNQGPVCHFFWRSSLATYPLSLIAQTGSVWTCVAITVDRFFAVQYPLHMRVWCTPHRARIVLNFIAVIAVLYKMPSIFELSLDDCGRLRSTQLRNHPLYIIIYNTYGYLLLLFVIPFFIIIVLNSVVVNAVRAANIRRQKMQCLQQRKFDTICFDDGSGKTCNKSCGGSAKHINYHYHHHYSHNGSISNGVSGVNALGPSTGVGAMNRKDIQRVHLHKASVVSTTHFHNTRSSSSWDHEKRCTKMAIVTIVTFVLFNWLAGVNNVIEAFDLDVSGNAYRIPIGNLFVCLNSATNILIYSIFGQRFRKLCAALLCPCFRLKYDSLSRSS